MTQHSDGEPCLVSVVIPCYNSSAFVSAAIDSVFRQTVPVGDVIAVDDGSTDSTMEVLSRYRPRLRIVTSAHQGNRGPAAARNAGLDVCRGEYVAFLDSDDVWSPTKIERQLNVLRARGDVGLVFTACNAFGPDGRTLFSFPPPSEAALEALPESLLLDCFITSPSSVMVRRSALERVGHFDETLRAAEDHDMWVRLAEAAQLAYIDQPLTGYRVHPGQLSLTAARLMWGAGFTVLAKACRRRPAYARVRRKRLAVLHFHLAACDYIEHRRMSGLRNLSRAAVFDFPRAMTVLTRTLWSGFRSPTGMWLGAALTAHSLRNCL
jgi:glycosyltransferase involved in cell wall biosynthesis